MTNLKETLTDDLKAAMRSGDRLRRDTLRMVLAAIKQVEIDGRTTLDDQAALALLQKEAKKRQESIADYLQAGNAEMADGERAELNIIEGYLPTQVSEEEIRARSKAIVEELGASGPQDIGPVMKKLMAEFQGRADGRLVNQIVRELLSS